MTEIKKIKSSGWKYIPFIVVIYAALHSNPLFASAPIAWLRMSMSDFAEEPIPGLASDQAASPQPEKNKVKPTAQQALRAHLVLTEDEQAFVDRWASAEDTPVLRSLQHVRPGRAVAAMLLVQHCRAFTPKQKKGLPVKTPSCKLQVDHRLTAPDGSVMANHRHDVMEPQSDEGLILVKSRLRLTFDANDPPGRYRLETVVRDVRRRQELTLTLPFTLIKEVLIKSPDANLDAVGMELGRKKRSDIK